MRLISSPELGSASSLAPCASVAKATGSQLQAMLRYLTFHNYGYAANPCKNIPDGEEMIATWILRIMQLRSRCDFKPLLQLSRQQLFCFAVPTQRLARKPNSKLAGGSGTSLAKGQWDLHDWDGVGWASWEGLDQCLLTRSIKTVL